MDATSEAVRSLRICADNLSKEAQTLPVVVEGDWLRKDDVSSDTQHKMSSTIYNHHTNSLA